MKHDVMPDAARYAKAHLRRKRWYKVVASLAAVVVFCTTYALILPAITMERQCALPEHTHTDACYSQVTVRTEQIPICSPETLSLHEHDEDCYDDDGALICGYADFVVHTHDERCYDEDGTLWCPLPEIEEHEHEADCWAEPQAAHTHDADCYDLVRGALVCEEDHEHDDDCYEWDRELTCPLSTEPEEGDGPELVCDEEEVILHEHDERCYDPDGALTCGLLEVHEHQHTDACFETREEPVDTEALTCTDTSEDHVHGPMCYGTWELTCGLEEHTHSDACQTSAGDEEEPSGEETNGAGEESPEPIPTCGLTEHTHEDGCYDVDGTLVCTIEEHSHTDDCYPPDEAPALTDEEQAALADRLTQEVEDLEGRDPWTDEDRAAADDLLTRLEEAYRAGALTDEQYPDLYARVLALDGDALQSIAEPAEGTNWIRLRDSGWFEEYSAYGEADAYGTAALAAGNDVQPSGQQIDAVGGTKKNDADDVSVSKTISGTDLENVFDITLQVKTPLKIEEIIQEPDMAVVIVMDISNTMKENFGGKTRYEAAMEAAEEFLDKFAASNTLGVSKIGYVAFNTDAHQIFGLQSCRNQNEANALKNVMRQQTGNIINANGYADDHKRFTNIEAGLKMGSDMLDGVTNENKFIIFLSDGFPTTYMNGQGYAGYDPYCDSGTPGKDGVFYDAVRKRYCSLGTSYSDKAAIRARVMANNIKSKGTKIFSIGVDVGGQNLQTYIDKSFPVVDRTGTTYEIGGTGTGHFTSWLENSIGSGSGYYYDSTNTAGLKAAYDQIFTTIKQQVETGSRADWVASDPIPSINSQADAVEFIGLYNKTPELVGNELTGETGVGKENTATFDTTQYAISWDLKKSGYRTETTGSTTTYLYELKYRVRLQNEKAGFIEKKVYPTNDTTTLRYRVVTNENGQVSVSGVKTIDFPIPSVHGFLGELSFTKQDNRGEPLSGAGFTLRHDTAVCKICRGDGQTAVTVPDQVATSGADGKVTFSKIPSGHTYTLTETYVPPGYSANGNTYQVVVAYDKVTVKVTGLDGRLVDWDATIVNNTYYELPSTGGAGTIPYTAGGLLLMSVAGLLLTDRIRKQRGDRPSS